MTTLDLKCKVCGKPNGRNFPCYCGARMFEELTAYAYLHMKTLLDKWHVIAIQSEQWLYLKSH
jgi:hypothetical protein